MIPFSWIPFPLPLVWLALTLSSLGRSIYQLFHLNFASYNPSSNHATTEKLTNHAPLASQSIPISVGTHGEWYFQVDEFLYSKLEWVLGDWTAVWWGSRKEMRPPWRLKLHRSHSEISGFKLCNQYKHIWQQMRSKVAKIKIVLLFECFYLEHFAVYLCSIHWAWVTLTKTSRAHLFPHWISRISKQCLAITVSKIEKLKGEDLLLVIK